MRIAYYHEWGEGGKSGVFKKIVAQVNEWARQGHEVAIFNLSMQDTAGEWRAALSPEVKLYQTVWPGRVARFVLMNRVVGAIVRWQPDIIYWRFGPYYPMLERMFNAAPVVSEHNGNDLVQARNGPRHRYWYVLATQRRAIARLHGGVFVGHEFANFPAFSALKKIVLPNGINLSDFDSLPAPDNAQPHLIFVGQPGINAHGLDKIVLLARHFPAWRFDLVGPTSDDFIESLPENVTAHGRMVEHDYLPLMAQADIAIGMLALHRREVDEVSTLKTLEYAARGLPFIMGGKDTNFMPPPEFILELPNTESNVSDNIEQIERFVRAQIGRRVPRAAIQHIDIRHIEQQRLDFLASVLAKSRQVVAN